MRILFSPPTTRCSLGHKGHRPLLQGWEQLSPGLACCSHSRQGRSMVSVASLLQLPTWEKEKECPPPPVPQSFFHL